MEAGYALFWLQMAFRLLFLYLVWGSTFLAVRVALTGFTPFTLMALRCMLAGALLWWWGMRKRQPIPGPRSLAQAAVLGFLMLGLNNGTMAYAMQWVSSGVAAIFSATIGLWVAGFSVLMGRKLNRLQWVGVVLGALAVAVLNAHGDLRSNPQGGAALMLGCAAWALGTVLGARWSLSANYLMLGVQYFSAGVLLASLALSHGEKLAMVPNPASLAALAYLTLAASVIGYTVYDEVQRRCPLLATSTSFVNPLVAVTVGCLIGNEALPANMLVSLVLVLTALACLKKPS